MICNNSKEQEQKIYYYDQNSIQTLVNFEKLT